MRAAAQQGVSRRFKPMKRTGLRPPLIARYVGQTAERLARLMQVHVQHAGEPFKVVVSSQDGCVPSEGHCADQEIGVGALKPFCPTSVETRGRFLVVGLLKNNVAKGPKAVAQLFELLVRTDPRQKLLTN